MNKVFVTAMVLAIFSQCFSDLYSPEAWYSFRRDTLVFSAGVSDDTDERVFYELIQRDETGRPTTLFTRTVRPTEEKEWTLEFPAPKRDVVGKDALWVKETIGSANPKVYGPYGFIHTKLIETGDSALVFSGELRNFSLNINETYKFAHNRNGLIIALGNTEDNLTVSIDPANSKTAFLAFANRIIMYNAENKSVEFYYPERSIDSRTMAVQYRIRDWEGEMQVFETANGVVIFIPWFDLGVKYEPGRRFGYMLNNEKFAYPARASHHSPASWGNLILQ